MDALEIHAHKPVLSGLELSPGCLLAAAAVLIHFLLNFATCTQLQREQYLSVAGVGHSKVAPCAFQTATTGFVNLVLFGNCFVK